MKYTFENLAEALGVSVEEIVDFASTILCDDDVSIVCERVPPSLALIIVVSMSRSVDAELFSDCGVTDEQINNMIELTTNGALQNSK